MNKCPYCGSCWGLYSKEVARYCQFYKFNGDTAGYSELDDLMVTMRKSTPLYCQKCDKRVGTYEKLFPNGAIEIKEQEHE